MWRGKRGIIDALALLVGLAYLGLAGVLQLGASARGPAPLDGVLARARERGALRVAVDVGYKPFAETLNGELVGYDIDLARSLAAKLNLQVEFVPTSFDALYDSLTSNKADLVISALPYAPEFGFRARFSQPYFDAGHVLVVRGDRSASGLAELGGQRVGVALGSDADARARGWASTHGFQLVNRFETPGEIVAALRSGTIDAAILDHISGLEATLGRSDLRIATALTSEPFVIALSPRAFQLAIEIDNALSALSAEGVLTELNTRWMGPESPLRSF